MKKIISLFTVAVLLLNITACGQTSEEAEVTVSKNVSESVDTSTDISEEVNEETSAAEASDALSYVSLIDAQTLGIITADYTGQPEKISAEKLSLLVDSLYDCFDAIGINYSAVDYLENDPVMSEFEEFIFRILSAVELSEDANPTGEADVFLRETGIIYNDITSDANEQVTLDEAMLMLARTVVYAANENKAGSKGLLWEVSDEDTTVYLLGSVHADNDIIYPFGKQLMDTIIKSDAVILEVDLGDADGITYVQTNSMYGEGDMLSNHISEELMAELMEIYAQYGITDQSILEMYRPWILASEIQSLELYSQSGLSPIVIDMYVYYKALEAGIPIMQIESYQYQTDLFNAMEDDVMEEYLKSSVDSFNGNISEGETSAEVIVKYLNAWRERDADAFNEAYDKDAQEDPISLALFGDRDENMYNYVLNLLEENSGQYLVTVGAGHMIGKTGIVERLIESGYEVNLMPAA